jgi:hypothetical protein
MSDSFRVAGHGDRLLESGAEAGSSSQPLGTLLIVGHTISDAHTSGHTPPADLFFTAAGVAATLDTDLWRLEVAESPPRTTTG